MIEIGIMGGAFNPIHSRHLMVAQAAIDQLGLSKVIFVPSGEPPHKKSGMLDKEARFRMVKAACAGNRRFVASRVEIDRPGPTWTIDTLKQFKQEFERKFGPEQTVRLNFIIGEDNLPILRDYDRRAEFLSLCRLVVSPRATCDAAALERWQEVLPEADIAILEVPANEVSSTLIRDWIDAGHSVRYLVHEAVYRILMREGYYAPRKNLAMAGVVRKRKKT
ncbi:MAG: nicotinate (nicotinamide) nucleotide adenylyltransferase [Candidatus Melainabacteria bacterium]|nr:nicotinate (nicotinamide) nucleotide adenylyltransferase [Candidatus Melainabacteria bacterium]